MEYLPQVSCILICFNNSLAFVYVEGSADSTGKVEVLAQQLRDEVQYDV